MPTLTKPEIAEKFHVTIRRVNQWIQAGCPVGADGRFNSSAVEKWRAANIRPRGGDPELAFWKTRLIHEQALSAELRYRVMAGELVDLDTACRKGERRITHAKALLEQIPERCLGLLPKSMTPKMKTTFRDKAVEIIEDTLFALSEDVLAFDDSGKESGE
jgi:phage terminase Nu1 subunit (DNA packaging protein)